MNPPELVPGRRYRHRKGGIYTLLCLAKDTTNQEDVVVYRDKSDQTWVRPRAEFEDGRFEPMNEENPS